MREDAGSIWRRIRILLGRTGPARAAYDRAVSLTTDPPSRARLEDERDALG
ncbi:hypothetical protein SUDANB121_05731 [Nocardiopsis dassonvillei]|uniref:hypothetical protein n=1 Tax=Nocardiopsis dassonvillei TaxID=2014 RepID=UPI003F553604